MKRELKFRAWDNEQRQMFQGEMEQFDDMLAFRFGHFGIEPEEDVTYMQFIGLKDKNGVEIYEGDIVSFKRGIGNWSGKTMTTTHIVAWDKTVARFSLGTEKESIKFRTHPRYEYEVIGNIFENPELVNEA